MKSTHHIELIDNQIRYHFPFRKINYKSWELSVNDIALVAIIHCMDGDEDSDILIVVDWQMKKYFVNLTYQPEGLAEFQDQFEAVFMTKMYGLTNQYDIAKIIYPKKHLGERLYQDSWIATFKSSLWIHYYADGKIRPELTKYIVKKEL